MIKEHKQHKPIPSNKMADEYKYVILKVHHSRFHHYSLLSHKGYMSHKAN